jgi:cytochrome c
MAAAVVVAVAAAGMGACRGRTGHASRSVTGDVPMHFGFGRPATAEEIKAWDIDVRPDGRGLPGDSGTVSQGAPIFAQRCASCHGADGKKGVAPAPALVGREPGDAFPFDVDPSAPITVGDYWPYAATLYDYIHRAMPLNAPGSLTPHETYAVAAFILAQNGILPPSAVLSAQTLPLIRMPARNRFVPDNRTGGARLR